MKKEDTLNFSIDEQIVALKEEIKQLDKDFNFYRNYYDVNADIGNDLAAKMAAQKLDEIQKRQNEAHVKLAKLEQQKEGQREF